MLYIVCGPLRSGSTFYTRIVSEEKNIEQKNFHLFWEVNSECLSFVPRIGRDVRYLTTWDEIKHRTGIVHAHFGIGVLSAYPEIANCSCCIIRNPRDSLVSASRVWAEDDLGEMIKGVAVSNPYILWQKQIFSFCSEIGFIKYEILRETSKDLFLETGTDWKALWTKEIDDLWEQAGMKALEQQFNYENDWRG